jgi:hypothetical protein
VLEELEVVTSEHEQNSPIVFLAMFWSGGESKSISEIIGVYDWINRLILTRGELEGALNYLLAVDLIERENEGFRITDKAYAEFQAFLEKRKKNKFYAIKLYFQQLPVMEKLVDDVRITDEQYNEYLSKYHKAFRDAVSKASDKRS